MAGRGDVDFAQAGGLLRRWKVGCIRSMGTEGRRGEGMAFANVAEVRRAYDNRAVELHAKVKVRIRQIEIAEDKTRSEKTAIIDTTVGRALLAEILPEGLPFALVNTELNKKAINHGYEIRGCLSTIEYGAEMFALTQLSESEESKEFFAVAAEKGLKAAFKWRDEKFALHKPA